MNAEERFFRDLLAISEEWDVSSQTGLLVAALQVMAGLDGCTNADESLAWAVGRGYVELTGSNDDERTHRVTATGEAAVREWRALGDDDA